MCIHSSIVFIGAGNMASAMIQGLVRSGFDTKKIFAYRRNYHLLAPLEKQGVQILANAKQTNQVVAQADIIVFAVKPWSTENTIRQYAKDFGKHTNVISLAAGIRYKQILDCVNNTQVRIVRAMPNTPVAVGSGVIGCYSPYGNNPLVNAVLEKIAKVFWLPNEQDIHAVTAIAGCGPAYYFRILEHMRDSAINLGLDSTLASTLAIETIIGAAKLASSTKSEVKKDLSTLIANISSPGSATNAALEVFAKNNLHACIQESVQAAWQKSQALASSTPPKTNTST